MKTFVFPLHTPMMPGCQLALKVFEPRYLDLVAQVGKTGQKFVISGLTSGSETSTDVRFLDFGCLVDIIDFDQEDAGLLHLRVQGDQLVELSDVELNSDGLWQANTQLIDYQLTEISEDMQFQMIKLYDMVIEHPFLKRRNLKVDGNNPELVINFLCMWLPLSFDARIRIMKSKDSGKKAMQIMHELDAIQQDLEKANIGDDGKGLENLPEQ